MIQVHRRLLTVRTDSLIHRQQAPVNVTPVATHTHTHTQTPKQTDRHTYRGGSALSG